MALRGALAMDLRRAFGLRVFGPTIVLMVMLNYLSILQEYTVTPGGSVVYFMQTFVYTGPFALIAMFLGLLPYGSSFCVDWKNQFIRCSVIRTSKNTYACAKVLAVAMSSFSVVFLGYLITIGLFRVHMPMVGEEFTKYGYELYDQTVIGRIVAVNPWVYLVARAGMIGAFCMFWGAYALLVSAYSANMYVALSAPIVTYYLVVNGPGRWLPGQLQLNRMFIGTVQVGGPWLSVAYALGVFVGLSGLVGLLFFRKVRHRLANG